jgi:hypothetical protein
MKVSLVPGEACWTLVVSSPARFWLRPLKKMWAGFWEAMNEMALAPRPFVPDG